MSERPWLGFRRVLGVIPNLSGFVVTSLILVKLEVLDKRLGSDAIDDDSDKDDDESGVGEHLVEGSVVADGHRVGDGPTETTEENDDLPLPIDLLLAKAIEEVTEKENNNEPEEIGEEDGEANEPPVPSFAFGEAVSEQDKDENLAGDGDCLDDVDDRSSGVGMEVGESVSHLKKTAGDDGNDAGPTTLGGDDIAQHGEAQDYDGLEMFDDLIGVFGDEGREERTYSSADEATEGSGDEGEDNKNKGTPRDVCS